MAKHRKRVPLIRRLATYGLCLSAVTVLVTAFLSQPVPVSSSAETPYPPRVDLFTSDSQPTPTPSPTAKTKIKRSPRAARQALSAPLPKIEKDSLVTPEHTPSIKLGRTSAPRAREDPVRSVTPTPGKVRSSSVVQRQVIPRTTIPKKRVVAESRGTIQSTSPAAKVIPKTVPKPTSNVVTTQRVAPPTPQRVAVSPKAKPQTVVPNPPVIPVVTSNSRCANIGLLPAPKAACNQILAVFPEVKSVLGVGNRAGNPNSCHPKGLAIDFIVGTNKALGDRLYAYVIARRSALGATPVVLWQVADHFDHVHVSFEPCKG
jgi:hypothetical protein